MGIIKDIETLFSQLVDNPGSIINAMKESGDILSGSRAANFFVGGLCNVESDWDFYCRCCGTDETVEKCHLYKYFENIGCIWKTRKTKYNEQYLNVYSGTINNKSIQLITHSTEDTIDGILGYHSTVPQCIVAYDSALCMYYDILKVKKAIKWSTKIALFNGDRSGGIHIADKYIDRGIKFITYSEYKNMLGGDIPEPRIRKSGDRSTRLLKESEECSLGNISWLECPEGCIMLTS